MGGVAAVASIVGTTIGVASSIRNANAMDRAAEEQRKMGAMNAANIEAETMEQKRRAERQASEAASRANARLAASGMGEESTGYMLLDDFIAENKRQIDWLVRSGQSQAELARMGANIEAGVSEAKSMASYGDAFGTLFSGMSKTYEYGVNAKWWD